jgi:hypothetical protein
MRPERVTTHGSKAQRLLSVLASLPNALRACEGTFRSRLGQPPMPVATAADQGRGGTSRSPVPFRVRTQPPKCAGRNGDSRRRRVSPGLGKHMRGRGQRYAPLACAPMGIVALVCMAAVSAAIAPPAMAASPWWLVTSGSRPSSLEPEARGTVVVTAANLGDALADGKSSPVSITDTLPAGLKPLKAEAVAGEPEGLSGNRGPVECKSAGQTVTCTFLGTLPPYDQIELLIEVEALEGAHTGELNEVAVSGAGARGATLKRPVKVGGEPPFGVEDYALLPEEEGGAPATQAGSHPFQLASVVTVNQSEKSEPVVLAKELDGQLPPGLIGNPTPIPQCSLAQFLTITSFLENQCAPETAVGVAMVTINERANLGLTTFSVPIFKIEPSVGEPARFGFYLPGTPIFLDASLRTGGDYGVTVSSTNISQTAALLSAKLIFWGVPGDPRHDNARGIGCLEAAREESSPQPCIPLEAHNPPPFLSLPTSCTGPLHTSILGASWKDPHNQMEFPGDPMPALDGCNRLSFDPSLKVTPDGTAASTPTGLNVDVHVPQDSVLVANGLAESAIRDITVNFPEGMILNPAAADGLQSCSGNQGAPLGGHLGVPPNEIGFDGFKEFPDNPGVSTPTFTTYLPGSTDALAAGFEEAFQPGVNFCPDASKVGTVKITTPLLPAGEPLEGALYLADPAPNEETGKNPFNKLLVTYIEAQDPISGALVKLPGRVELDQNTGRLTAIFENTPQLAFEDAEIHLFGGQRAPLATPKTCGTYTTEATYTPWSGNAPVKSSSSFQITTGPGGGPCPASPPFAPTLAAGSPNINGGGFSPLTTTISRSDGNQNIKNVQLHMAPGMSGILAGIPLCGEAQANAGTCSEASEIGKTIVSVGVGPDPFTVTGGKVYLTEHYGGGQFGLSIVNPAVAGPFDLGKVVVRASIQVDPTTAQLTITTGEIPRILDGFPLEIQHVNVLIDRPGFTFNPTSCNPFSITGTIGSHENLSAAVSTPFQVTNCASLKYTPSFTTTTAAKATRPDGASLNFRIAYPKNAMGSQAWFNFARFQIPKQLPARLTTIQKACLATTFEHDRSACPAASIIGHALVHTQVLPVPLEGPVYFVSYGGAKFPDAVLVLKGYGITIELHGHTFIDGKTGVTTATFESLPDVPFESIEVSVPQGPFSEFGANLPHGGLNFCGQKLSMPVSFKASNGLEIHQNTNVGITGCPKTKTRAQKLAAAIKACHKKRGHKRAACVRAARKHYGAKSSRRPSRKR